MRKPSLPISCLLVPPATAWLLLLLSAVQGGAVARGEEPPPAADFERAALIRVEGMITPMIEQYIDRKLERARSQGADLVILEIDSPGGYLESSVNIATKLRDLGWAHTVAYVPQRALSGAAIAALGADEIVMRPSARIGDAGPIYQDEGGLFRHAPEKIRTDLARTVRDLAEDQGRPPALAEAMVDMDLVVYRVRNAQTGEINFMSDHELEAAADVQQWEKLQPVLESREGHFLEVSGRRAVELQLAQATVTQLDELKQRYELDQPLLVLEPSFVDTAVFILNMPFVTFLLLIVGLVALYVEFSAPGISLGGLLAGLCFALFFWSRFLGGTSGWLEVTLFACGAAFLAIELFIIPGFGVAGAAGLLLILTSIVMASVDFIVPSTGREMASFGRWLMVVVASGAVFLVAAAIMTHFFGRVPVLNWMILEPPAAGQSKAAQPAAEPSKTSQESQEGGAFAGHPAGVSIGDWGIADTPLRPAGKVWFEDQYVDVVSDGGFVEKGKQVRIIQISGNRIVVREMV